MKVVILAGGYANRLRSVTNNGEIAKTLLEITAEGKTQPILYFLLDKVRELPAVDNIILVANDKYKDQIVNAIHEYASENKCPKFTIISDGSNSPEHAMGANFALNLADACIPAEYDQPILVTACDNYFDFDLNDLYAFYTKMENQTGGPVNVVASKLYPDSEREFIANNFGILNVDKDKRILSLDEKPGIENIKTNNVSLALYMFNRDDLGLIDTYMSITTDKKKRDSLGYFINYVTQRTDSFTYEISGAFCDIGTPDEYYKMKNNGFNV